MTTPGPNKKKLVLICTKQTLRHSYWLFEVLWQFYAQSDASIE